MNSMLMKIQKDREKLKQTVTSLSVANQQLKLAQKEIVRAEKLAATGRISAGLAHEIGNPVSIVQGYLELLGFKDTTPVERQQFIERSLNELRRVDTLLRRLLDLTRERQLKEQDVFVSDVLADILDMLKIAAHKRNVRIIFNNCKKSLSVFCEEQSIRQVFLNLLLNALDGSDEKKANKIIQVTIEPVFVGEDREEWCCIRFWDNGTGISNDNMEYVFEPFFTTKDPGEGTGLGLSIAYKEIKKINGIIEVKSELGEWTEFKILLPVSSS